MVRGGQFPELRRRPTLDALQRLATAGLMPPQSAQALARAYTFLRQVEHRIQYLDDQQTHVLPTRDDDLAWIASTMGYRDCCAFLHELDAHRELVAQEFDTLLGGNGKKECNGGGCGGPRAVAAPPPELEGLLEQLPPGFRERVAEWRTHPRVTALRDEARARLFRLIQRTAQWLGEGRVTEEAAVRLVNWLEPLLRRELSLFPDWYLARHRGVALTDKQQATLDNAFNLIVAHNLAVPSVFVHRDFMTRNLMVPLQEGGPLAVLDFQDAVYGPITYDIASLLRDAFISWEEEFVIDVTVRYWEKARKAGLLGANSASGWGADFGEFYRAVEWMGLQRHLKVAGIFARLTLRDGKAKYLADAPRFIAYIRHTCSRYIELKPLLRLVEQIEGIQEQNAYAFGRV